MFHIIVNLFVSCTYFYGVTLNCFCQYTKGTLVITFHLFITDHCNFIETQPIELWKLKSLEITTLMFDKYFTVDAIWGSLIKLQVKVNPQWNYNFLFAHCVTERIWGWHSQASRILKMGFRFTFSYRRQ
jgi:hypothetical protein